MSNCLTVIGGGLAGSEAAWQAARFGIKVNLYEMRPQVETPAHKTGKLAELVCSNSLRADTPYTAPYLLKEELRKLKSLIITCADKTKIPAGRSLAVDREEFSLLVENTILNHSEISVIREEVSHIPDGPVVIATGPLTSSSMTLSIKALCGENNFYFYDAVAPIISFDSINQERVFKGSRYDEDCDDYLNCPMTEEEYNNFYNALMTAEKVPLHDFEEEKYFEGCLPVEVIGSRGIDSLRYGPLKPIGLIDPKTGERPFAVVQLRAENKDCTMYNMVGFQTRLKWEEQKRIFRMIPGMEKAEFYRYGVIHRNSFINSPQLLCPDWSLKKDRRIFFAGQLTGIEGYMESTASGFMAGINAARFINGMETVLFPRNTALGALANYVTDNSIVNFQPMKMNYGIFEQPGLKLKKEMRRKYMFDRALRQLNEFIEGLEFKV